MGSHRPDGARQHPLRRASLVAAAAATPVLVSVAWVPLRQHQPNVDVALLLVVAVAAWGAAGRRTCVLAAAVGAAAGFAFFDTRPYERWVISRQPDIATLAVLVAVSAMAGELSFRGSVSRRERAYQRRDMAPVREIAALVASGEELVGVIGAVAVALTRLLGASQCSYEAGDELAGAAMVGPDGRLGAPHDPAAPIAVPVRGMGRLIGQFVVSGGRPAGADRERLLVALTLADQVGAALIAQAPQSAADQGGAATVDAPGEAPLRPILRVVD